MPARNPAGRENHAGTMGAWMARSLRNFNLENRAERAISKRKPLPAPRHPTTENLLQEQMNREWCGAGQFLGNRGPWGAAAHCLRARRFVPGLSLRGPGWEQGWPVTLTLTPRNAAYFLVPKVAACIPSPGLSCCIFISSGSLGPI